MAVADHQPTETDSGSNSKHSRTHAIFSSRCRNSQNSVDGSVPGTVLGTQISIVSLTATTFIARDMLVLEQSYLFWRKAALSLTQ